MTSVCITREDIILALDTLYTSGVRHIAKESRIRLIAGIVGLKLIWSNEAGDYDGCANWRVYSQIREIDSRFENNREELHQIAETLRRNKYAINSAISREYRYHRQFYNYKESLEFPEGRFLGDLHRYLEKRDGEKIPTNGICAVCHTVISEKDRNGVRFENHLLVPPTKMDSWNKYAANYFATVCSVCHEKLHRYRPWIKEINNCEQILR